MAKTNDVGLVQLKSGNWSCRLYMKDPYSDRNIDTTFRRNENGEPFKTKTEAKLFRDKKIQEIRNPKDDEITKTKVRLKDVWEQYLATDSKGKAVSTVTKYKSLWKNHISKKFGDHYISDLTVQEINNFLNDLYESGLSYAYVESFLKEFYMLYGLSYRRKYITRSMLFDFTEDKKTRIKMPEISQEEQAELDDIKTFSESEIAKLEEMFKDTNLYTAFLLGYYLGVRISECFGLMWSDIEWGKEPKITINKQLVFEDGCFCLKEVKTLKSVRTIDIPQPLYVHLGNKYKEVLRLEKNEPSYNLHKNEVVLDKRKRGEITQIIGGDFINRKYLKECGEIGRLLTTNSMKYYSKKAKAELGIEFKYHSLRKTHLTKLAEMNTPVIEVMQRAGHKKYDTTMKFYVNVTESTHKKLIDNINSLKIDDPVVEFEYNGVLHKFRQSELEKHTDDLKKKFDPYKPFREK